MTTREKVISLRKENLTVNEIAERCEIHPNTVKWHLYPNKRKTQNRKQLRRISERTTALKIQYGGKCIKCGYDRCFGALHFHHTDPSEKEFNIGRIANRSQKRLIKELKKCELLCANCHAEVTFPHLCKKTAGETVENVVPGTTGGETRNHPVLSRPENPLVTGT